MSLNWDPSRFQKYLDAEMNRRLDASAIEVANHVKELLSAEGTGQRKRRVRNKKGKLVTSKKLVYNANPSKPGDPPALQTGRLRGSYAWERNGFVRRVGTNVKHGRPLELGAPKIHLAARPHLLRALMERRARIDALMRKPITGV